MPWQVDVTDPAVSELQSILRSTRELFGSRQADAYRTTLLAAVGELRNGPQVPGSRSRDDLEPSLRSLHVARHRRRGRHMIFYRVSSPEIIEVLRILHEAMDFVVHLS